MLLNDSSKKLGTAVGSTFTTVPEYNFLQSSFFKVIWCEPAASTMKTSAQTASPIDKNRAVSPNGTYHPDSLW